MSKKIAAVDKTAMDELYVADFKRVAGEVRDSNGAPEDPVAFSDHEEYLTTLESVLKEDKRNDWEPNDVTLD
jgi:hypothetical protein